MMNEFIRGFNDFYSPMFFRELGNFSAFVLLGLIIFTVAFIFHVCLTEYKR